MGRYRILLLLPGLAGLGTFAVLSTLEVKTAFLHSIAAYSAIVFVWFNGAYWLLEATYPHIESESGVYVSRFEQQTEFAKTCTVAFYFGYTVAAVFATVICLRIAAGG